MRRRDEMAGAISASALGIAALLAGGVLAPNVIFMPLVAQLMPYLAGLLILLAVPLALLRRGWRGAACVLVACTALGLSYARFQSASAGPSDQGEGGGEVFTLISFNALHSNTDAPQAVPYLLESGADAILLLEADELKGSIPRLMETYRFRMGCEPQQRKCDTVLLSKYPPTIAWKAALGAVPAERYVQFSLNFHGRPLTVIGAHLIKPYFDDLALIELSVLTERINRLKGPVILAGDFNSTPWVPAMTRFADDTGLRFSGSYVATWPASAGRFGLPIDHVMTRAAPILDLRPMPGAFGSNHRGLIARIAVP